MMSILHQRTVTEMEETNLGKFSDIINMEATVCHSVTARIDVPSNAQSIKVGTQEIQSDNIWWVLSKTVIGSLATFVLDNHQGKSALTCLGERFVDELLWGVASDREALLIQL